MGEGLSLPFFYKGTIMTGNQAITYVRELLRDVETPTRQGQFWHDNEILLCLNIAQSCYIHSALSGKLFNLLDTLLVLSPQIQSIPISTLTPAYLHYSSAYIINSPTLNVTCQIYSGEESLAYRNTRQEMMIIQGNDCTFYNGGVPLTGNSFGQMWYYRYPGVILGTNVNMQDFTRDVYRGAICRHAAVLLGQKELNNQRNQKDRSQTKLYSLLVPSDLVHKYGDIDIQLFQKDKKR